jgi:membrane protease YdiL (CAAX protease family)
MKGEGKRMFNSTWRILAIVASALVLGILGLLVGALIGGNFAEEFTFNRVRGYEATGQIGFLLGAAIGVVLSWRVLAKKRKPE